MKLTRGPLVGFILNFDWYIPRAWGPVELILIVSSLIIAAYTKTRGINRVVETDIAFLAIIVLGSFTFAYEGPLILVAPVAALFVATTIATPARKYVSRSWVIYGVPVFALLIQMMISPTNYTLMYHPHYDPPFVGYVGSVVLFSLAVFASGLLISFLKPGLASRGNR